MQAFFHVLGAGAAIYAITALWRGDATVGERPSVRGAMSTIWATGSVSAGLSNKRAYSQPIDRKSEETPPIVGNRLSDHNQSTASMKRDTPTKTTGDFLPTPQPSALDVTGLPHYYAIIAHAVSQLERQDSFAREDLYEKARRTLFHKLRPDGRWNLQWKWNASALEEAIRWVEDKWARADRTGSFFPPYNNIGNEH
jgi:hypothetical protein